MGPGAKGRRRPAGGGPLGKEQRAVASEGRGEGAFRRLARLVMHGGGRTPGLRGTGRGPQPSADVVVQVGAVRPACVRFDDGRVQIDSEGVDSTTCKGGREATGGGGVGELRTATTRDGDAGFLLHVGS
jgi:hypothetical protein